MNGHTTPIPIIDIIVPNWNGRNWLEPCLTSLLNQTFRDFRIILVDNASTDGSVEYVNTRFPSVEVVELQKNTGFAGGINAGIMCSSAPYICWFNNDAEAAPDFLEKLLLSLQPLEPEGFAMAAPRITLRDRPNTLNSAGIFIGPDGLARERGFLRPDTNPYDKPVEVFGPAGAAAFFKREVFERVGVLDEDYFMYGDEDDISYRAQLAGYRCLYVPEAQAMHAVSGSAATIRPRAVHLACCNSLLTIFKNMPAPLLLLYLPLIIAGQFYQLIKFGRRGMWRSAIAGKLEALRLLPKNVHKRRAAQRLRKISLRHFHKQLGLSRNLPSFLEKAVQYQKD
jgi:GT2 family glycosyltransferase